MRSTPPARSPPGRWLIDPSRAFDPRIALADHVYTTRGGFVDGPRFDPVGTGLDPKVAGRTGSRLPPGALRREPGVARCADGAGRSTSHRRRVRQYRAADRDGVGALSRGAGRLRSKKVWAFSSPARELEPAVECVSGRIARRGGRDRAGIGGRRLHARRGLRIVALRPQTGRGRAAFRACRCHDQRRGFAARCALYPDGILPAPGALAPRQGHSARSSAATA